MLSSKAFFLDRDGTINADLHYISKPEQIVLLPGVAKAIHQMHKAGYLVIVITNQSGVARGYFSLEEVKKVNERLNFLLQKQHASIDAFYICPHLETGVVSEYAVACTCRKPMLGLYQEAIRDYSLNAVECAACGDNPRDIERLSELGMCPANLGLLTKTPGVGHYIDLASFTDAVLSKPRESR